MSGFVWIDLIVVALVLVLGIKGLANGFVREIFGLIGLIGGVIAASRYANNAGQLISTHIYQLNESGEFFFGFLAILIVFWVACLILGALLAKALKMSGLGAIDRLLGFVAGSAKIFLVLAIFAAIISKIGVLNAKISPYFEGSVVYPTLLSAGQFIMNQDYSSVKSGVENAITPADPATTPATPITPTNPTPADSAAPAAPADPASPDAPATQPPADAASEPANTPATAPADTAPQPTPPANGANQ